MFLELISNPTIFFLLVGLFFIAIGMIVRYLWTSGDDIILTNDRYTPQESITNSKRSLRHWTNDN